MREGKGGGSSSWEGVTKLCKVCEGGEGRGGRFLHTWGARCDVMSWNRLCRRTLVFHGTHDSRNSLDRFKRCAYIGVYIGVWWCVCRGVYV